MNIEVDVKAVVYDRPIEVNQNGYAVPWPAYLEY